ncbi:hypothetical protein BRD56_00250 [Thermoplasmatales archaeon SW_10_69_26]|nr:MAG: hypothetical protein BRD56_00250 [Thermoplasmatales archaeon SW_10_69_26]
MAGVPLVGKTTLARHLVRAVPTEAVHAENDRLRRLVVDAMGRQQSTFDGEENHATYEAARHVVEQALERGLHVVHDATNLRKSDRQATYAIADAFEAPGRVAFVHAPDTVLGDRADRMGPDARQALEALGDRQARPSDRTRPHLVLDGTRSPEDNVDAILADDAFVPLARPD